MRSILRCLVLALTLHGLPAAPQIATSKTIPPRTNPAQASTAGVTVHRVRAGALDSSGWSIADSTQGEFAVRVPCLFNDFSLRGSETLAGVETVGCRSEDQRKYSASRFKYRQGASAARKYFEDISGARRLEGETARRRIMFSGFPAIEVDFRNSSQCGTTRSVLVGAEVMQLTVEGPSSACTTLTARAASFFASLQMTLHEAGQAGEQQQSTEAADSLQ
jgi:hypothetical protein